MNTSALLPLNLRVTKLMSYQQFKQENKKLKDLRLSCEEQLEKLRDVGRAHENEIDTLLKFNERLLGIIENEFNSAARSRLSSELHPITEANQTQPELAAGEKLKTKLPPPPPRIGGGVAFEQEDLDVFLDEDEEEIYNLEAKPLPQIQKTQSAPPASRLESASPAQQPEVSLPVHQQMAQPISQPMNQQMAQPMHQQMNQQMYQQMGQPLSQPINQQMKQQTKQAMNPQLNQAMHPQLSQAMHPQLSQAMNKQTSGAEKGSTQKKAQGLKLEKAYERPHNKEEEISINLSNSMKNAENSHHKAEQHVQAEVAQLKELIKEYKEEFVDNSSEYEQICQIIHNDLICDLQEFKKVANDSRGHFHDQFSAVESLKNEIRWFKPANELMRVMKKLNVPSATERLLFQRIIHRAR